MLFYPKLLSPRFREFPLDSYWLACLLFFPKPAHLFITSFTSSPQVPGSLCSGLLLRLLDSGVRERRGQRPFYRLTSGCIVSKSQWGLYYGRGDLLPPLLSCFPQESLSCSALSFMTESFQKDCLRRAWGSHSRGRAHLVILHSVLAVSISCIFKGQKMAQHANNSL